MELSEFLSELSSLDFSFTRSCETEARTSLANFLEKTDCWLASGASRFVFVAEKENWVVKVDRVVDARYQRSFCEEELEFWEEAKRLGCESCLAPVLAAGKFGEIEWLAQAKLKVDKESENSVEELSLDFAQSQLDPDDFEDENDFLEEAQSNADYLSSFDQVVAVCGDVQLAQLVDSWGLNDLHSGNWGWNEDGALVLFDYAGWN